MSGDQLFEGIQRAIDAYLDENGWYEGRCDCGKRFYYKRGRDGSCQRRSCEDGFPFLEAGESNDFQEAATVGAELASEAASHEFDRKSPVPVENHTGTTFLTSAAVQQFDDVLFEEAPYEPETSLFVAQPSVRMNAAADVGDREGFSTSFVNVATLAVEPRPSTVVDHLDAWFEMLSSLGLLVSNFALSTEVVRGNDWGRGSFPDYVLSVNYGGLTLGEVIVHGSFPQENRGPVDVLDAGFGLERIAWAVNRSTAYFDAIGPIRACIHRPIPLVDAVRTLTLLAGQGIDPGPEGAGYRFRQCVKRLLTHTTTPDFEGVVAHHREFWSQFCDVADVETIRRRLRSECDRQYNRRFPEIPNTPDVSTETERYIQELANRGCSLKEIKTRAVAETARSPSDRNGSDSSPD